MATNNSRPIGSKAKLNGRVVVWAGPTYQWQSAGSFKKLEQSGEFKVGGALLNRLGRQIAPAVEQIKGFQQQVRKATPWLDPVEKVVNKAVTADDQLPSSRVSQGGAIVANNVAAALNIDPRLALGAGLLVGGVKNAANSDDSIRAARAEARRYHGPGGNATPRSVRLRDGTRKGGEVVRVQPDAGVRPARPVNATGDPLARARSTSQEAFLPQPPRGTPGTTRNVGGQISSTGARTTARVSAGGYRPSGGTQRNIDADGKVVDLAGQLTTSELRVSPKTGRVERYPTGQTYTDLRSEYDTIQTHKGGERVVLGIDPSGRPITVVAGDKRLDRARLRTGENADRYGTSQGRVSTAPANRPFAEPRRDVQANRPSTPNKGRDGVELRRLRAEMENLGAATRNGGVTIQPSYENGSRIIYGGGSANVRRVNPYDPDPARARYRGQDQSPRTSPKATPKAALHEGGDDVFDADGGFSDYNVGYSETKRKGQRGTAGASSRSVSREVRQRIIDEYQSDPGNGAVYETVRRRRPDGTRYRERTLVRKSTKLPSADYINERLQRAIGEKRAELDAATGRRTADAIAPGNRFRGNAERKSENVKLRPEPSVDTYGGSMPRGPVKRGSGPVVKSNKGIQPAAEAAVREQRAAQRGQRGPTTYMYDRRTGGRLENEYVWDLQEQRKFTDRGSPERKAIDEQIKAVRERTLSRELQKQREATRPGTPERRAVDQKLETLRDPRLSADTDTRNRGVRAQQRSSPVNVQGVLSRPFYGSSGKREAQKIADSYKGDGRFGLRVIQTSKSPAVYRLDQTQRVSTGKHNTAVDGRNSRPVRGEFVPPEPKERPRKGYDPLYVGDVTGDPTIKGFVRGKANGSESGYWAVDANGGRKWIERSTELTNNRVHNPNRGRVTPAPGVKGHNASVAAEQYAERQRARRRAERAQARGKATKPPELEASDQQVKEALKDVALRNRSRSGPIDPGRQEAIRQHNAAVRDNPNARRLPEFRGVPLEPEIIRNPAPEFPNRATPPSTDGRWKADTYGDVGPRDFKSGGELRGVSETGRTKNPGRSAGAARKAAKAVDKTRTAKSEGKTRVKRAKPTGKQTKKQAQMEAIRARRAAARKAR